MFDVRGVRPATSENHQRQLMTKGITRRKQIGLVKGSGWHSLFNLTAMKKSKLKRHLAIYFHEFFKILFPYPAKFDRKEWENQKVKL